MQLPARAEQYPHQRMEGSCHPKGIPHRTHGRLAWQASQVHRFWTRSPPAEAVLAKEVLFGCVTLDAISELEVVKADLTLVRATKCDHRQWYTHAQHPVNAIIRILRPTWSHTIESGLPLLHYLLVGLLVA